MGEESVMAHRSPRLNEPRARKYILRSQGTPNPLVFDATDRAMKSSISQTARFRGLREGPSSLSRSTQLRGRTEDKPKTPFSSPLLYPRFFTLRHSNSAPVS